LNGSNGPIGEGPMSHERRVHLLQTLDEMERGWRHDAEQQRGHLASLTARYVIKYFSLYSVYIQSIFSVKVSLN
jgi:hypothetical protein